MLLIPVVLLACVTLSAQPTLPPEEYRLLVTRELEDGWEHADEGQYALAETELFRAMDYLRVHGPPELLFSAYHGLSVLYAHLDEGEAQLRYARLAYEMRDAVEFNDRTAAYNELAYAYGQNLLIPQALEIADEWLTWLNSHPGQTRDIDYHDHYSTLLDIHGYDENLELVLDAYQNSLSYDSDGTVTEFDRQELRSSVGTAYVYTGRYAEALPYLEGYVQHSDSIRDTSNMEDDLIILSEIYENLGRPEEALAATRRGHAMRISQMENEMRSVRSELEIYHEVSDKNVLIDNQQRQLTRQRQLQIAGGVIVLLLALGLAGLFFGRRENRRKNALLEARNRENETLLKEIHHRVKNNLEVVSSLLELQSVTLDDQGARDAMLAGRSRVSTMGILHQKLYQGDHLGTVGMREYFTDLTQNLGETFGVSDHVSFRIEVPDELRLDVDTAVPLGLIANELITNSIKYAFVGGAAIAIGGAITVKMSGVGERWLLAVSDDGSGKTASSAYGTGFGTRLVGMLVQQLGGELRELNDGGLRTEVRFRA